MAWFTGTLGLRGPRGQTGATGATGATGPAGPGSVVDPQTINANSDTITLPASGWSILDKRLVTSSNRVMSSTPTIPDGAVDGQIIILTNISTANTIALQSDPSPPGDLNNSNMTLVAGTVTLGPKDSITLEWIASISLWVQWAATGNVI